MYKNRSLRDGDTDLIYIPPVMDILVETGFVKLETLLCVDKRTAF
jgi:hypothetical protein